MSRLCWLAVVVLFCSLGFAQYSDSLLAIVGDEVITMYNVQAVTSAEERNLAKLYKGEELEQKILQIRRQALSSLIERELLYKEFVSLGAKVPPEMIQGRINDAIMEHGNGKQETLEDKLQEENMTLKDFRARIEKDLAIELLVRDRTNRGNIVSDKEVEERYEADKDKFATGARWRIAVILLKMQGKYADTDATFKEILGKLADGISFEELAKQYSEGAGAEKGGDQGWMDNLNAKLKETVDKLKPGQTATWLTDIGSGRYIVKLVDEVHATIPALTDELREKIRNVLKMEEEQRRYDSYIRELYMKYPVRRVDGMNNRN